MTQTNFSDPYTLIQKLNTKLNNQSIKLSTYKKMYQSSENEKSIILLELKKKKDFIQKHINQIEERKSIEQNKSSINQRNQTSQISYKNSYDKSIVFTPNLTKKLANHNNLYSAKLSHQLLFSSLQPNFNKTKPVPLALTIPSSISSTKLVQSQIKLQQSIYMKGMPNHKLFSAFINNNSNQNEIDFIPNDVKIVDRRQQNGEILINLHKNSYYYKEQKNNNNYLNSNNNFGYSKNDNFGWNPNNEEKNFNNVMNRPGTYFIQDFLIIGADINELRKKKQTSRKSTQFILNPGILYHNNSNTSQNVLREIATRCFPAKISTTKRLIQSYKQLRQVIQFKPSNKLSKDYFLITLCQQKQQQKNSSFHQHNDSCYQQSNPNQFLYIFVIKLPDFIHVHKDEKNYQRKQQQIWNVEKCYAVATYYPFLDILISMVSQVHAIHMQLKMNKIQKEDEKFYMFDLRCNVGQVQKNDKIQDIISYFRGKKVMFDEVIYHNDIYYGTIPSEGYDAQHALSKYCAPVFMSCFSYEQSLLLLSGILCQKSIIFLSKYESLSTFCALFLTSIINPFPMELLLLNIDENKMQMMMFDVPFPMIATVKRTSANIQSIIYRYVTVEMSKTESRKDETEGIILVDIDSRSIFYNNQRSFQLMIYSPSEQLFAEYVKFNPSFSKSFSFPKKLTKQNEQPKQSRKKEQIKKAFKQMSHKIQTNEIKYLTFQGNTQIDIILRMMVDYIKSFVVEGEVLQQALKYLQEVAKDSKNHHYGGDGGSGQNIKRTYKDVLREGLLKRHQEKAEFVQIVVNSQYYANFLSFLLNK